MGVKNGAFLVSGDQIQKFFDLKRTINKDVLCTECF